MDFRLTDEQQVLRKSVREFAEAEIRPYVMEWDEAQHFPESLVREMAALGLMAVQLPEDYEGAAMSAVDYCICIEELARVDPAVALSVAAHNGLCSAHIFMFGTEAQRKKYLPPLARGEMLGAWGLTEPTSGSDAAGMRTTAVKQGECWCINGAKTFITHGSTGGVMVVMAVTDRALGNRGISAFIVERGTTGMRPGKKENKLGMRASDTSEVVFTDCRVPAQQLLGELGQGFVNTMQVLDAGRIGIAALSVGLAQGAYEAALAYARERKAFGKTISSFQAIQFKLADAATRIEAARLMTYRAAYMKEQGQRTTLESSMA
ncbi:MAG TPA: acyl-CoA dehydrogenase family protein, partial [Burkholderiaceae bacterium]|nr:acyl-CoA dehydrogenase family protein [Burkholderiaceae bacterium]